MWTGSSRARPMTRRSSFEPPVRVRRRAPDGLDTRTDGGPGRWRAAGRLLCEPWHRHPHAGGALCARRHRGCSPVGIRSEEHTSELKSLMRISYAVICLKDTKTDTTTREKCNDYTLSHNLIEYEL